MVWQWNRADELDGEADRFVLAVEDALETLSGIETWRGILTLTFDDGTVGGAHDYEDIPGALYSCLADHFEIPHTGWLHAVARVLYADAEFDASLAYEGVDGPIVMKFADGTVVTTAYRSDPQRVLEALGQNAHGESVRREIEAVVTHANLVQLVERLDSEDQDVAETLLLALSRLGRTPDPPKRVVREAAIWLARKVDLFLDEAARVSGKAAGVAATAVAAYQISKYFPELRQHLERLLDVTK